MQAYVELVQRREREIGCDVLTHQKVGHFLLLLKNIS
jgi:isocitrate lyase